MGAYLTVLFGGVALYRTLTLVAAAIAASTLAAPLRFAGLLGG